jgi:hypothetical protein
LLRLWGVPTILRMDLLLGYSPGIWTLPTQSLGGCELGQCGSTVITTLMPRCHSVVTSRVALVERRAAMHSRIIPKSKQ